MMTFKDFEKLTEGDLCSTSKSIKDYYNEMAPLVLPPIVPKDIRTYFDCTRLLYVYGYYCFTFFGWVGLHACIAVEMALRRRLQEVGTQFKKKRPGLRRLLKEAVKKQLLSDNDFREFEFLKKMVELSDFSRRFNQELNEIAQILGEPEHQEVSKDFTSVLADFFPTIRNAQAHGLPTDRNTPFAAKWHVELAAAIITVLFNKNIFPVGYHKFHKNQLFNFTLNRWYSFGYARFEDMLEAGKNIRKYEDWKPEMVRIADKALSENRLMNAAIYFRSAEFFALPQDTDKELLYDKFSELFYKAFQEDEIQRFKIPYEGSYLPTIKVTPTKEKKGTILLHGGMDSFLEEWYLMMKHLASDGYEVIGFEGPGQGAALIKAGLALDYKWEKPTSAILDYFNLDDVTLFGLSMGGWFCLRAAAFEPRIKRVVASGHAIHYMEIPPAAIAWMFEFFMKFENFFNKSSYWKMEKNPRMKWEISNAMHITKTKTPFEAAQLSLDLSRENMHAEQIKQDVLLFSGRNDHFIPIKLHKRQVKALVNAKSVTDRIFTKEEHAQNHCQIGNIGLVLDIMVKWIEHKSNENE